MKIDVSVIVPVYNEEKWVGQCLASLAKQTQKKMEILVGDDGSTDSSAMIVCKAQTTARNVQLFRFEHQGVAKTCNALVDRAQGGIIVKVDGDMVCDPDFIQSLARPIERGLAIATFSESEQTANADNWWAGAWNKIVYLPTLSRGLGDADWANTFRAIKRPEFVKRGGYKDVGYDDDTTVFEEVSLAWRAKGARCNHFNPDTLGDVFASARWIGRSRWFVQNWWRIVWTHGPWGGIVKGVRLAWSEKDLRWLVMRGMYDTGLMVGVLERKFLNKTSK